MLNLWLHTLEVLYLSFRIENTRAQRKEEARDWLRRDRTTACVIMRLEIRGRWCTE